MNKEEPAIVFLMETKVDKKEWIDKVKERCKLKHGLFVPRSEERRVGKECLE